MADDQFKRQRALMRALDAFTDSSERLIALYWVLAKHYGPATAETVLDLLRATEKAR